MSIKDFSEDKYIKTFDNDEEIRMGAFMLAENKSGPLRFIRTLLYIQDYASLAGNEQLTMKLYTSIEYENVYATSSVSRIADISITSDVSKPNWIGYLLFTFDRENLNAKFNYYPTITISNYTRNADSFYLGVGYDYPDPIYDNSGTFFYNHPIAMQIFTDNERVVE